MPIPESTTQRLREGKAGPTGHGIKSRYSGSTQEAIPKGSTIRNPVLSIILCGIPRGRSKPLDLVITFCRFCARRFRSDLYSLSDYAQRRQRICSWTRSRSRCRLCAATAAVPSRRSAAVSTAVRRASGCATTAQPRWRTRQWLEGTELSRSRRQR